MTNCPPGVSRRATGCAGFCSIHARTHHIVKYQRLNRTLIRWLWCVLSRVGSKACHTQLLSSWRVDGPRVLYSGLSVRYFTLWRVKCLSRGLNGRIYCVIHGIRDQQSSVVNASHDNECCFVRGVPCIMQHNFQSPFWPVVVDLFLVLG